MFFLAGRCSIQYFPPMIHSLTTSGPSRFHIGPFPQGKAEVVGQRYMLNYKEDSNYAAATKLLDQSMCVISEALLCRAFSSKGASAEVSAQLSRMQQKGVKGISPVILMDTWLFGNFGNGHRSQVTGHKPEPY